MGFDQIFTETDASDITPGTINYAAVSLMSPLTLPAAGVVTMTCESREAASTVQNISLIGVQVGGVTSVP